MTRMAEDPVNDKYDPTEYLSGRDLYGGSDLALAVQIQLLGGKGQLCNAVSLGDTAVEGVVFCGNIHIVHFVESREAVLHMQTIGLVGGALNEIIRIPIISL